MMMDWKSGDEIVWLFTPRGGYGYSYYVTGQVVRATTKRVLIRVRRHDNTLVERWVKPDNVKARAISGA